MSHLTRNCSAHFRPQLTCMCLAFTVQVPRIMTCYLFMYAQSTAIREKLSQGKKKKKKEKKESPGTELDKMNMFKMVGHNRASSCGIGAHFLAFTINFGTTL